MITITSVTNPLVKDLVRLHDSKGRKHFGMFLAEGSRVCSALLSGGYTLVGIYCTEKMVDTALLIANEQQITIVSQPVMDKISSSSTASGICATFTLPDNPDPSLLTSGIVLANIQDPGNMGALIRSCVAFGKKSIVFIQGADPFSPKVIQASAGTLAHATIFRWSWQELLKYKKELLLLALVVKDGKDIASLSSDSDKSLIVIGNEAQGIPIEWQKACDELVTIPMPGNTESLNAAIAGSLALYVHWILKNRS